MKDLFDKIYKNELDINYGSLLRQGARKIMSASQEEIGNVTEAEIEQILIDSRNDVSKPFSELEVRKANKFLEDLKKEVPIVKEQLYRFKSLLHDNISQQTDKFALDISKSEALKKASVEVFNASKTKISYEDYITLLELKKQMEIDEQTNLLLEEENAIFE
jgi:hypothetical protein